MNIFNNKRDKKSTLFIVGDCVDEPPLDSNDDETGPSVEETFDTG